MAGTKPILTKGEVICFFKNALRSRSEGSHGDLVTDTLNLLLKAELIAPPDGLGNPTEIYNYIASRPAYPNLKELLTEAYVFILIQGIIIPRPCPPTFGRLDAWENYVLTQYGREWASSDLEPIPEDIDGFISHLRYSNIQLDHVIIQYVSESLRALDRNLPFASAVMLGAASEKLFYILADAVVESVQDVMLKAKLSKLLNDTRMLGELRRQIENVLSQNIKGDIIPFEVHTESLDSILSLFNAIRIQRNDAVHPISGAVDSGQVRLLLLSFPHICKKVYTFIGWLKNNHL